MIIISAIAFGIIIGLLILFLQGIIVFGFSQQKLPAQTNTQITSDIPIVQETNNVLSEVSQEPISQNIPSLFYDESIQDSHNPLPDQETESIIKVENKNYIQDKQEAIIKTDPYKKQFIAMSFDGSYSLPQWENILKFSTEQKLLGTSIHFTFFISGVYLLPEDRKTEYTAPKQVPGKSNIGFGGSPDKVKERISLMEQAARDGHEIASHANGHYGGSTWSYEEWLSEFNQFDTFISIVDVPPVQGMRAPLLEKNTAMYQALHDVGQSYDTSDAAKMDKRPWKDAFDIWHFPLVFLTIGGKKTLSMDYNHYVVQTQEKDILKKGTPEWQKAYDEVYKAYIDYFDNNYNGNRIPLNIGHHFSLWNDGLYYQVLLDFAKNVCAKPDVICGTYSELVGLLEKNDL